MRYLNSKHPEFSEAFDQLLNRKLDASTQQIESFVSTTISEIRTEGDAALLRLTQKFDGYDVGVDDLEVDAKEMTSALEGLDVEQREALEHAANRIKDYHQHQLQESWSYTEADGTVLGQKVTPIKRVGIYVPGGKAAYPSSVLMNAIPAKVAGVEEIIMVSPCPGGEVNDLVLAAAQIAGVDRFFKIGGAQAVAALAHGTETIPAVDKITGPGNAYVATAKKQLYGQVGIDMIAGPSEVLVIADDSVDPDWVAMDLFAQAEHDELAPAIFLTVDADMAESVQASIDRLLPDMERQEIIKQALNDHGAIILAKDQQQLIELSDQISPEQLEIFTRNAQELAEHVRNAGALCIGAYSAESLGDYCAGPNHVLPTSGTARFSSPLGVQDFQKRTSIIQVTEAGAQALGKTASILARGEALTAHARSAEYRIKPKA
jgi:histidinol dehydrogenase